MLFLLVILQSLEEEKYIKEIFLSSLSNANTCQITNINQLLKLITQNIMAK